MPYICHYQSPIGTLEIKEENEHIIGVCLLTEKEVIAKVEFQSTPTTLLQQACIQLAEYFAGERTQFTLPISYPYGTPFQHSGGTSSGVYGGRLEGREDSLGEVLNGGSYI